MEPTSSGGGQGALSSCSGMNSFAASGMMTLLRCF